MKTLENTSIDNKTLPALSQQEYIAAATSSNTRKTYRSVIRRAQKWGLKLPWMSILLWIILLATPIH